MAIVILRSREVYCYSSESERESLGTRLGLKNIAFLTFLQPVKSQPASQGPLPNAAPAILLLEGEGAGARLGRPVIMLVAMHSVTRLDFLIAKDC